MSTKEIIQHLKEKKDLIELLVQTGVFSKDELKVLKKFRIIE